MTMTFGVLVRFFVAIALAASLVGPAFAQSALAQQFMNLGPAEREQMMRQFGLSPDDVLGAIRDGAGSATGRRGATGASSGASQSSAQASMGQSNGSRSGMVTDTSWADGREFPVPVQPEPPYFADLVAPIDYGQRYGLEVFGSGQWAIQELYTTPVPDDYVLSAGDELIVSLYGAESGQYYAPVMRNGAIELTAIGPITVAGMTFQEAREMIGSRIAREKIGVQASVTVDRLRSLQVSVSGEVERPGVYVLPALVSLTQVLSLVGGPTEIGALRRVAILRAGERIEVDLYDAIVSGTSDSAMSLQPGDTIHVPAVRAAAGIGGAVRRPGVYELLPGETLDDLLRMAGGLRPDAAPTESVVRRYGGNGRILYADVDFLAGELGDAEDGMVVRVPSASEFAAEMVELQGEVTAPGIREWHSGLMLSALLGDPNRTLNIRRVDLDHAYVVRTDPRTREISFLSFAPRVVAAGATDLMLQAQDVVLFLPLPGIVAEEKREFALASSQDESLEAGGKEESGAMTSTPASRSGGSSVGAEQSASAAAGAMQLTAMSSRERGYLSGPSANWGRSNSRQTEAEIAVEPMDRIDLLEPYMNLLRAQARDGARVAQFMIAGEVHAPGTYPITDSADMAGALTAAGGLLESADRSRAVVLRKSDVSAPLEVFEVPMGALKGDRAEIRILPGDVITIGRDPSLANRLEVRVGGEVASPGAYTLPAGSTLSDLIEIAGGVTPRADLRSAIFSRARLREMENQLRERYIAEIRKSLIDGEVAGDRRTADPAVIGLLDELQNALDEQADGRLQIDLPRLAAGDESAEVFLSTGDRLTIPSQTNAVSVAGQVRAPGSFAYVPGMTADAYLELAGGLSSYSDKNGIFVVRADGSVQSLGGRSFLNFARSGAVLYPGDRVVVPIDTDYINAYDLAKDLIQFTYQTGIGLAAVVAALK